MAAHLIRSRPGLVVLLGVLIVAIGLAAGAPWPPSAPQASAASSNELKVLAGAPTTLDPAIQGDANSAAVTAQLFESLTAFDASLVLRPALAESWQVDDAGRRVTFTLRPDLQFSDGSRLTAADVVRSWLRLVDPRNPSPLASLMDPVTGAAAYRRGENTDPSSVGLKAVDDSHVEVSLDRPASDFPSIVASPSFGVVPPGVTGNGAGLAPATFVASGAYRLANATATELTLQANPHYWAGPPPIAIVHLVTDIGGRSPVAAFEAGDVDYTPISDADASWIEYSTSLGPQLRKVPSLSVTYFGFDTRRAPFNDARVRRAFALAVNWSRMVTLGSSGSTTPATSMVPPGIVGRSTGSFAPAYDPAAAKAALAAAGYPGGAGFPKVVLVTGGTGYEDAIVRELNAVLGIDVSYETMTFDSYFTRLAQDPPAFWALSWVADYPGQNDFLGLLLGTGQTNNYGRWSNAAFDAAIAAAGSTVDPARQDQAFADAQAVVAREAPVVPVAYDTGWALSRTGLLGAGQNGLGFVRLGGTAWQP